MYNYSSSPCGCGCSNQYQATSKPYQFSNQPYYQPVPNQSGDRFIGAGFAAPFLLGGLTGLAVAPAFAPRPFYPGPWGGPWGVPCCGPRFW